MSRRIGLATGVALAATLLTVLPVGAQTPSISALLASNSVRAESVAYELRAQFTGTLRLVVRGVPYVIGTEGWMRQSSKPGEPRRTRVTVERVRVPFLLQPFSGSLRGAIADLIEAQTADPVLADIHDLFITDPTPGRITIGGVRRELVSEAMERYMPQLDPGIPEMRTVVARWLYSSQRMQSWLRRPGPPYLMTAVVGSSGLLETLSLTYDWGTVETHLAYTAVGARAVWRTLDLAVVGDLKGIGPLNGQLALAFSNYCLNCQ